VLTVIEASVDVSYSRSDSVDLVSSGLTSDNSAIGGVSGRNGGVSGRNGGVSGRNGGVSGRNGGISCRIRGSIERWIGDVEKGEEARPPPGEARDAKEVVTPLGGACDGNGEYEVEETMDGQGEYA
jgi:hypothetical protein